jgi:hypothetical protein
VAEEEAEKERILTSGCEESSGSEDLRGLQLRT